MSNTTEATITISGWGDSKESAVVNLIHELRNLADQLEKHLTDACNQGIRLEHFPEEELPNTEVQEA
jgi:hypothetical protein